MGRKKKRNTKRAKIDPRDVRIAVQHLVELAVGFEKRGSDAALRKGKKSDVLAYSGWDPTEEDETFEDDERCLEKVIGLLLAHRRRQQEAQRNAFIEGLVFTLSKFYSHYLRDPEITALTLETKIQQLCGHLGLNVGEQELELLAPERGGSDDRSDIDGEADTLHAMQGAVESAKTIVSKLVGLSFRRIREIRDDHGHPLAFTRRPFGRFVPRQGRLAYVVELYEQLERATRSPTVEFHDLRDFDETVAIGVDRVSENLMALMVHDSAFRAANLPPKKRARIAAVEEEQVAALRTHVLKLVEAGYAAVAASDLPEPLRTAALRVAEAVASDVPVPEREPLEGALEASIRSAAHAALAPARRKAMIETFGAELDTIPKR